jgi:hypothetical protein
MLNSGSVAVAKPGNGKKAEPRSPRMTLDRVTTGKRKRPMRVLLYGTEGIGKSTWAASAPSPIFLGAEDGTAQLDIARFPEPELWADAKEAIRVLTNTDHNYKTLAIDTLDWLEPLAWQDVCLEAGKKSIEDLGYGKGYVAALDKWRELLSMLDTLREKRGMHIIMLAHSRIKTFRNPEGDDFDRYELKLHDKSGGLVKEWCDAVLFAVYETLTAKDGTRVRGVDTGARIAHTERRAAFDAKNRYGLPASLPLDWAAFAEAVEAGAPADPAALAARIEAALVACPAELAAKARDAVTAASGDAGQLARILDRLTARLSIATQNQEISNA